MARCALYEREGQKETQCWVGSKMKAGGIYVNVWV